MNTQQNDRQGWLTELQERIFTASMPQVVQSMRHGANVDFRELVRDLDTPMDPAFEREVARTLDRVGQRDLIPSVTLMPEMMQRFGLGRDDFGPDEAVHFGELQTVCNRCPVVGRCWKAMRAGESRETCRGFCPNALAFDGKSLEAAS
jgi:hypothetical protein